MRIVDGKKIVFCEHDDYFKSFFTDSMYRRARRTGADVAILLGPGKTGDDISDDEIREFISAAMKD